MIELLKNKNGKVKAYGSMRIEFCGGKKYDRIFKK